MFTPVRNITAQSIGKLENLNWNGKKACVICAKEKSHLTNFLEEIDPRRKLIRGDAKRYFARCHVARCQVARCQVARCSAAPWQGGRSC